MKYVPGKIDRYGSGKSTLLVLRLSMPPATCCFDVGSVAFFEHQGWQTVVVFFVSSHAPQYQVVEDLIQKHKANKNQADRAMVYLVGSGNLGHPR